MRLKEFERRLPLLRKHYDAVLTRLDTPTTHSRRKVNRRAVIERFLQDREVKATAFDCHVSKSAVRHILWRAIRVARELEGEIPAPRRKMKPLS